MIRLASQTYTGRELRWIADAYEQAQRVRIQTGERIRAVLQGRDATWSVSQTYEEDADTVLTRIRKGESGGPVPILSHAYRWHWELEREMGAALAESLHCHPAWPWLSGVRGVGATLAGKLLARLRVDVADTPSAFWAYCGLATVPGTEYRCDSCGLVVAYPVSYQVSGSHQQLGSTRRCKGRLERTRDAEDGVRVAQPRSARGAPRTYDPHAKKSCYLIAISFLKVGGPYEQFYRTQRAKLDADRPGWPAKRRHLTALRKMEKLFLSHLWLVWREAVGLPVTLPYLHAEQEGAGWIGPEEMSTSSLEHPRRDAAGTVAPRFGVERPRSRSRLGSAGRVM